ncbi:MAG: GNAT family N-acetyltransferase [Actinopolymorphaceae bacterium]
MWESEARRLRLVQLRLECIRLDEAGRLVRASGSDPDEISTCSVARFTDGYDMLFSAEADEVVVERATALPPERYFEDTAAVARHVAAGRRVAITRCSTYAFADSSSSAPDDSVVRRGPEDCAAMVAGREVAWASSSRSDTCAAELWAHTDPEYQGQGYGRQVATAWAAEVVAAGKVAFYSHLDDNLPSRRLAASLGVRHLFDLANVTVEQ